MSIFWYKKEKEEEDNDKQEKKDQTITPKKQNYTNNYSNTTNKVIKDNNKIVLNSNNNSNSIFHKRSEYEEDELELLNSNIRTDVLLNIAFFLARRWSDNPKVSVNISRENRINTNLEKNRITLPELDYFQGNMFQKYRQWRTLLWYESMRIKNSFKIYDTDIVYGYIFNIIETKRVEIIGLEEWKGMLKEVIYYEALSWNNRPLLNTLRGKDKIIEAFSQFFLTGFIKGELYGGENERVLKASEHAQKTIKEFISMIKNKPGEIKDKSEIQKWLEKETRQIIRLLQIDSLMSMPPIPLTMPKSKIGLSMNKEEINAQIEKIVKLKTKDTEVEKVKKEVVTGKDIKEEFKVLMKESKKNDNKGFETTENLSIAIPNDFEIDETQIYDLDLINKTKTALKDWKLKWKERYDIQGDEIEIENFIEKQSKVFINDKKIAINAKIALLLDLSSSIEDHEIEYKKATIALCEGLNYLGVKFSLFAFNTESKAVKCWIVKPHTAKWNINYAKRLKQIKPLGGTPLAEVYKIIQPNINSFKPNLFVTMTDGEPSDMDAVRSAVLFYKRLGINMIAIGLGSDTNDAIGIGFNLKYLNYEKTLTLSKKRLQDLPKKVLGLLAID